MENDVTSKWNIFDSTKCHSANDWEVLFLDAFPLWSHWRRDDGDGFRGYRIGVLVQHSTSSSPARRQSLGSIQPEARSMLSTVLITHLNVTRQQTTNVISYYSLHATLRCKQLNASRCDLDSLTIKWAISISECFSPLRFFYFWIFALHWFGMLSALLWCGVVWWAHRTLWTECLWRKLFHVFDERHRIGCGIDMAVGFNTILLLLLLPLIWLVFREQFRTSNNPTKTARNDRELCNIVSFEI